MRPVLASMVFVAGLAVTGCASVRLPLCPKLAATTHAGPLPAAPSAMSRELLAALGERGVRATELSTFVADFAGPRHQVRWLTDAYPFLLCGFDPTAISRDEESFMVCLEHAEEWMAIVEGPSPADLMLDGTQYAAVCLPTEYRP